MAKVVVTLNKVFTSRPKLLAATGVWGGESPLREVSRKHTGTKSTVVQIEVIAFSMAEFPGTQNPSLFLVQQGDTLTNGDFLYSANASYKRVTLFSELPVCSFSKITSLKLSVC